MFQYIIDSENTVIEVFSPVKVAVDLNHDRKVQNNEIFCISGIETFSDEIYDYNEKLAKSQNISYKDALSLAYLTTDFAKRTLTAQSVKIVPQETNSLNCQSADILVGNKSYKSLLYTNGFGFDEKLGYDKENFEKNLNIAKNLHPVIFNRKSLKYHEIDCKYGKTSEIYDIILEEDLPQNATPCKWCHSAENTQTSKITYPDKISDGSIEIILTDSTTSAGVNKNCSTYVCKNYLQSIKSAQKSIDIAAYGWVDIPVLNNAIKDALSRGVKFRIVYDYSIKNYYPDTPNIVSLAEISNSDYRENNATKSEYLMHNKFTIIDNQKVYTGSLNYSDTDFSAYNSNFVAVINSEDIAKIYTEEFEQMLNGKFHNEKKKRNNYSKYILGNSEIEIYFSPQDKTTTEQLINRINSAQKYIYIPAFVITHKEFSKSLINAYKRGIDVKVIADATNANSPKSVISTLRQNNIPAKIENFAGKVHSKSIIIDDEYIIAGSMNFSSSGENRNDENTLIIKNSRLSKFYREFFEYLWNKIPDKYLTKTPSAESLDSAGSCFDGIDNDYDGKIDKEDEGCFTK